MQTVSLHFEEYGTDNEFPLIILHGFFASNRNWRFIAKQLSDRYHVFNVDLRNHGSSLHHELMDYPSMAHDLKAFIDAHGLAPAHILGHSMGGKVAMWFALHFPAMLQKLIVVDVAPMSYEHSFDPLIDALKALPLNQLLNRKQADEWLSPAIENAEFRQFLLQNLVLQEGSFQWRINLDYFKTAGPFIVGFPDLPESLQLKASTLFIKGEQSNYVHETQVYRFFPHAIVATIANAGHWLHVEAPEAFLTSVNDFLNEVHSN